MVKSPPYYHTLVVCMHKAAEIDNWEQVLHLDTGDFDNTPNTDAFWYYRDSTFYHP